MNATNYLLGVLPVCLLLKPVRRSAERCVALKHPGRAFSHHLCFAAQAAECRNHHRLSLARSGFPYAADIEQANMPAAAVGHKDNRQ